MQQETVSLIVAIDCESLQMQLRVAYLTRITISGVRRSDGEDNNYIFTPLLLLVHSGKQVCFSFFCLFFFHGWSVQV